MSRCICGKCPKRVFTIDVGKLSKEDAEEYIKKIFEKYRKENPVRTKNIDLSYDIGFWGKCNK